MKKSIILCSFALLLLTSCKIYVNTNGESDSNVSFSSSPKILIRSEDISTNIKELTGTSTSADFKISGDGDDKSYVELYAKAGNKNLSKDAINDIIEKYYSVKIERSGSKLILEAKRKTNISFNNSNTIQLYFIAHVPSNTSTHIESTSGDLDLNNVTGTQFYASTSGDSRLSKIKGNIDIRSTSGDATLNDIVSNTISYSSTSGDIITENCSGNLHVATTSGDINSKSQYGNTDLTSTSGDVNIHLLKGSISSHTTSGDQNITIDSPQEKIDLSASSGDIHLKTPKNLNADLDISGSSIHTSNLNNFSDGQGATSKRIIGKLNGGGIAVRIRTSSGDIDIQW